MATNIPSKYKDIISKSDLIQKGPPDVYQLKPKVEEFGTLKKKSIGERNIRNMNKTILLVGETGAGKSALIDALVNYIMGVKFEDEVWFQIVEEEKKSQTGSQTSDVIVYEVFGFEDKTLPFSLTIIDTPGFGDTRGVKNDAFISERLFDLFRSDDGVHELHAVGLVMKASDNRLTDRLMYVFNSVTSLFGKNVEKNLVALITHSDGRTPKNALRALEAAKIKFPRNEKNQPAHFLFNNCQHEDQSEDEDLQEKDFILSQKGMNQFSEFLEKRKPQKLQQSIDVLKKRIRLTACIQNLQERIELIELKKREIQQTREALKTYKEEMKKNKNFTMEVDEVYKDKIKIDGGMWDLLMYRGAVCCTRCEENCHHPGCTMAWYPRDCEVMKGGNCTVCSGKCPASNHVKKDWIYVTKTRRVQKTEQDLKVKYEENKSEHQTKSTLLENLEKEMEELSPKKWRLVDEAYKHVVKLEEIAMNVDSVSTYVHLDFLIEKMKEKQDTEKVQKLEDIKGRTNGGTQSAFQYGRGKLMNLKMH